VSLPRSNWVHSLPGVLLVLRGDRGAERKKRWSKFSLRSESHLLYTRMRSFFQGTFYDRREGRPWNHQRKKEKPLRGECPHLCRKKKVSSKRAHYTSTDEGGVYHYKELICLKKERKEGQLKLPKIDFRGEEGGPFRRRQLSAREGNYRKG